MILGTDLDDKAGGFAGLGPKNFVLEIPPCSKSLRERFEILRNS